MSALQESLLSEVSSAFDSLNSKNDAGANIGPSPVMIYKAASLLYEYHHNHNVTNQGGKDDSSHLKYAFDHLLRSMEDDYVSNIILKEINAAFDQLTEKARESLNQLTYNRSSASMHDNKERLEKDLSKCFGALKALQIIYGHENPDDGRNKNRGGDGDGGSGNTKRQESQSQRCCRLGFHSRMCEHIAFLYDAACQLSPSSPDNSSSPSSSPLKHCILGTLSSYLIYGLVQPSVSASIQEGSGNDQDEAIQSVMQVIQAMSSEQSSTCLGDLVQWQAECKRQNKHFKTLRQVIEETFGNQVHAQKEYLFLMLSSAKKMPSVTNNRAPAALESKAGSKNSKSKPASKPKSGIDRLIAQIQSIFPPNTFGDGFLEAALACYNHDVERTTSALLELQVADPSGSSNSSIHPRLRMLDRKLPSRRKENKSILGMQDEETEEDREAKLLQKERLREMEVQQENEAYLLQTIGGAGTEYDDDYDDQYDGVGGGEDGVGGMDGGLYDVDYEAIKAYNKVAKEMEEDRLFWEENQNTNKKKGRKNKNAKADGNGSGESADANGDSDDEMSDRDDTKKYRGPDKGKGGRIIGPDGRYLPFPKSRKKKGGGGGGNGNGNGEGGKNSHQQNQSQSKSNGPARTGNKKNGANPKVNKAHGKGKGGDDNTKQKPGDKSAEMTKIQKRRKNDNKAKIGNHHRKERAMKKAAM